VQPRLRQIVTRVVVAGEPPRQFALFVLVNINERGNAGASAGAQVRRLLQAGAGKIADGLGPVGIAVRVHEAVELGGEIVVDGDGHALHRTLLEGVPSMMIC
jgi:hypothetical protein